MVFYFRQLWNLVKPYKVRLFLGVLCGVLSGLANPLLMATVKVVTEVVFPATAATPLFSTPDPSLNRTNTPTTGPAPALAQPQAAADQNATLQRLPRIAREALARLSRLLPARKEPLSGAAIVLIVSAIPFAMFLRGFFAYLNIYFMAWVSIRTVTDLRTRLFAHLVNLSVSFFHRTSTGELITRINSVDVINLAINTSLSVIIREPVTIVSLLTLLILQQPRLTLVALMVFPLCIIPGIVYGRRVRKSSVAFQAQSIGLVDLMHETFTANRIVKAYNLEGRVVDQFGETSRQFVRHYMRMVRATELPGPMIEFMGAVGVAMFFLYIAFVTKQTPGDFLQFVGCIFLMYAPVKSLTRLHSQFAQSRVVIDAIFNLLQTTVTVPEPAQPKPLRAAGADIRFESIGFSYGEKPVLSGVNVTVKAGQLVALVGASGSGKTTMTSLLLRFYDPQQGVIRIGDTDIRDVSLRDLRSQIAVVTQETILFNDTIARNIELGRPGASRAEIEAAARHAHASEFIREKPQGFDTVVGEKGILLSGGQRQRIAIARAILKNAPILVLDEATSSLDTESERAVQAALDELMVGRTTLCIAHRLSTIQHADVIVVMAQGHIVETGTHEQLLARGGHYRRLYELQFKD
jgi:subfamily B ATP-binding cassette protein MsbA